MQNISEPNPIADRTERSSSGFEKSLQSPLTRGLLSCYGIGAFLFTATYFIEGITRPGYDAWQQPVSALSLGPGGWVQQVNFFVFGILVLISVFGWYRLLAPGRFVVVFLLCQSIAGLGLIGAGLFSVDPFPGYPPGVVPTATTVHGMLHSICAIAIIFSLAIGCFVINPRLFREPGWRGWVVYSILTGIVIIVFFVQFVEHSTVPVAGLLERVSTVSHALWSCLLVLALLFRKRQGEKTA